MLRVPPQVAIQVISHVNKLFRHHDLDSAWFGAVDPGQVDEDQVPASAGIKRVGSANRCPDPTTKPLLERGSLSRDPEIVTAKIQEAQVSLQVCISFCIANIPDQELFLLRHVAAGAPLTPLASKTSP
jgi:hypothetical protein